MFSEIITTLSQSELRILIVSCLEEVLVGRKMSANPQSENTLLSLEEAATFLNLGKQTMYGYTSNRTIPFIKRGKKLYFQKDELEKWLMEGKKMTKSEIEESVGLNKKGGNKR